MSDIIYTPPASGGGGQNPTTNYIPLNNGTANFVDSNIFNDVNSLLYTFNFINGREGLRVDFFHKEYSLGDFDYNNLGTTLFVDDNNEIIRTTNRGNDIGLRLNFNNGTYLLGDYNDIVSGTYIVVNTTDRFINLFAGDMFNDTALFIDDLNSVIKTIYAGNDIGLKLDFATNTFKFGDFASTNNGTCFIIDDTSQKMTFNTGFLNFVGASLSSNTAGGSSGRHLVLTLNGTQYKIALLNP